MISIDIGVVEVVVALVVVGVDVVVTTMDGVTTTMGGVVGESQTVDNSWHFKLCVYSGINRTSGRPTAQQNDIRPCDGCVFIFIF